MRELYHVVESNSPLFLDAYLLDGEHWVFGSFWGSETTMQEFFARLTLPNHEEGLRAFTLVSGAKRVRIHAGQVGDLIKVVGKTPPTTVLGALCNVWIFDPALQQPNRSAGEAYVIGLPNETPSELLARAWTVIQDLSQIPLLEHWCDDVMDVLNYNDWIVPLDGQGVKGIRVSLPAAALESAISDGVKRDIFSIAPHAALTSVEQCALF